MTSHTSFATPTQADVDRYIAQAHQMRSEYMARSLKAGLNRFRSLFSRKITSKAAAV